MNIDVAKNAIGPLDLLVSEAREALLQVQGDVFKNISYPREGGSYDNPDAALVMYLEEIYETLLVVLEGADLSEARISLGKKWPEFLSAKGGLRYIRNDAEYEHSSSPALTHLERIVRGLRMTVSDKFSTEEAWTLNRLEVMLRNTSALVRQRGVIPKSEVDVRDVMHDYLRACFTGFRKEPSIRGLIKDFRPDCGITEIGAAIEFKMIRTEEDIPVAFSGIAEDTAVYKGSKDWTRFYAVLYQAEPFLFQDQVVSDMTRIGAISWKTITVNYRTRKKSASKKAAVVSRKRVGSSKNG